MSEQKKDKLADAFLSVWHDLMAQGQEGLSEGNGAQLLRVEGGRAVLLHLAKLLGYEVSLEEKKDGRERKAESRSKSRRGKKAEKGS